jgi:tryptophan synthase alpha chain
MSRRIQDCFAAAAANGRKVLVPFVTAGDPEPAWTVAVMHALVEGGADLIELGVPFSDPMADGPVIQLASERAIDKGVTLGAVLDTVAEFRRDDGLTPVVLMGYMNPLERYGHAEFLRAARAAGVDGLLLVDCPPEESGELDRAMRDAGLDNIHLVAPTTTPERLLKIAASASGFIYYVSLKGITGAGLQGFEESREPIARLRASSELPVAVGFGIKTPELAAAAAAHADAVVVGSALVEMLAGADSEERARTIARAFVARLRESLDNMAVSATDYGS